MQKGLPLRSLLAEGGQILIWIITGVLVIAIAGGAYYLGRSTSPKPSAPPTVTSQTPQPIPSAAPTSTPDETANWKTYTDNIDHFTIKYPPSWSVRRIKDQIIFATTDLPGGRIELTINNENDNSLEPFKKLQNTNNNPISVKEVTVNSLTVNEVHHTSCITNNDCITVVVKNSGKIFAFSPWIQSERYSDLKIIYQMLSTFRFD